MGFRAGAYATVWDVRNGRGNWVDVRLSISRKSRQSGEYETDFSGFVRFIGEAAKTAADLQEKDRIKIKDCDVTNHYDRDKGVTYTNYAVFSYESADGGSAQSQNNTQSSTQATTDPDGFINYDESLDEELPFV